MKCKCLQQNSGSKIICSLKCGFRRTLHKISAEKNLYWLTGKKMPSHQITRLKGSIQFSKLKLYNTNHWILSSLFCTWGNHSHMTEAYFPETSSLERFIIIPFVQNYCCCILFQINVNTELETKFSCKCHETSHSWETQELSFCPVTRIVCVNTPDKESSKEIPLWWYQALGCWLPRLGNYF